MIVMRRAFLVLATFLTVASPAPAGQDASVLHIKVVLTDADRKPMPVPGHALLISHNPATAEPQRVLTRRDGSADVPLGPGSYTVESDTPVVFNGKAYGWTQIVNIAPGHDAVLELTADNAEITSVTPGTTPAAASLETDDSLLAARWQAGVLTLWTATARASSALIGADGLVVTSRKVVGTATTIEVQVTPAIKVPGTVIVADAPRDVAVLRIDPTVVASVPPVPLVCTPGHQPKVASGQKMFGIDAPLNRQMSTISGTASRVAEHDIESDFYVSAGSAGGPVFTADGVVGLMSVADDTAANRRGNTRIVPVEDVCAVVAMARAKLQNTAPATGAAHLPVEPEQPFPIDALKEAVQHRTGNLSPYQVPAAAFDVFLLTPVLTYGAEYQAEQRSRTERGAATRETSLDSPSARALTDFGNWSDYVAGFPPVLLVRVTPKLAESFWTKVARGAAQTQGVSIPPIKRFTAGFSRMRAYCGGAEVTPIHPFTIERRVSESDTIEEGLYVFDPSALGPSCGGVKLVLFSEKEPAKADTVIVDPTVIQRIWEDFAPYRALK